MQIKRKRNISLIKTIIVFILIFVFFLTCFNFTLAYREENAKRNASYFVEDTIRKVETIINRYMENADLYKNVISNGTTISDEQFDTLSRFMKGDKNIVEAYELAPNGVVEKVYPLKGNESAIGLDMLTLPERKDEALLAKQSGTYTIAGPYELKQGGEGILIFDPIYLNNNDLDSFWGYSIMVLNWQSFLDELQIERLANNGYHFKVYKNDSNGQRIPIMSCGHENINDTLIVMCDISNVTLAFEIVPIDGWISLDTKIFSGIISFLLAIIMTMLYWQLISKKYKEEAYTEKLEEAAKQALEANRAKSNFLFNMSHDIRTPMNAIVGYTNLLEDSLDNKEKSLGYIEKIKASNSMLLSLINYVLEMAKIESGHVELKKDEANLNDFVKMLKSVFEPQALEKNIKFSIYVDFIHTNIICDTTKVREIITNIVSNAIKYTPNGGECALIIYETVSDKDGYGDYYFIVEDNGIGMSKDYLPHIFEEFSRERTSTESKVFGVGLGLPIVKSLVDMMKGTIGVESNPNKGSKFTIYLPLLINNKISEVCKDNFENKKIDIDFTNKKVLLVEDNELNAEIALEILNKQGFVCDCVYNGKECLELLNVKPELYYDLILMDIQMPIMNGYEATKAIRGLDNKNKDIPIIAMTANAFQEDIDKCLNCGMNDHIAKPISVDALLHKISNVLSNNQ